LVYAGVFIAACAIYPAFPGVITWLASNLAGSYKRSVGMALQIGLGNLGGACAANLYRQSDSPRYRLGHALELGFIGAGIISCLMMIAAYSRINKKRSKKMRENSGSLLSPEELSVQGDRAVTFRYVY
jgi:hypothetical protein